MALSADQNGEIHGKFSIPANVPAGRKAVTVQGERTNGTASYTGNGVISTTERRRVTTITTVNWNDVVNVTNITNVTSAPPRRTDPLAQTFQLETPRHIAGVDLWFKARGSLSFMVQIRETTAGVPNDVVLSHVRLSANVISLDGPTRIEWTPVYLEANREYALVVLTDDAEHALAVAEVGQKDPERGFITAQTYQVGVLLSSANAATWTAHQFADMTFRLLAAKFSPATRRTNLAEVNLGGYTDLMLLANIEYTASAVQALWQVGNLILQDNSPVSLSSPLSDELQSISAQLSGNEDYSPVVYPGIQLAAGRIRETGTYISRAQPCGDNARVTVRFEALVPGQSSIAIELEVNGVWQTLELTEGEPIGDGWEERTYLLTPVASFEIRVRLTLHGSAKDRPKIKNLRVMTNDA